MASTLWQNVTAYTQALIGATLMAGKQTQLSELRVGDTDTLAFSFKWSGGTDDGQYRDPITGTTFLVYDPDVTVSGTAASGSTTTLVHSALTGADDFWIGVPLTLQIGSNTYQTEVTDYVASTHTLTFTTVPEAVTASTTYTLAGTPVKVRAAATLSGHEAQLAYGAGDVTGRPGNRVIVCRATFTGSKVETFVAKVAVRQANYV